MHRFYIVTDMVLLRWNLLGLKLTSTLPIFPSKDLQKNIANIPVKSIEVAPTEYLQFYGYASWKGTFRLQQASGMQTSFIVESYRPLTGQELHVKSTASTITYQSQRCDGRYLQCKNPVRHLSQKQGRMQAESSKTSEEKENREFPSSLESLEGSRHKGKEIKSLSKEEFVDPSNGLEISTEQVVKIAIATSLQHFPGRSSNLMDLPFYHAPFAVSEKTMIHVELAQMLIASANKVSKKQYDRASQLLRLCDEISSISGNPVQRVVYYFSEALRERIARETGTFVSATMEGDRRYLLNVQEAMMNPSATMLSCHMETPFCQIAQFTSIQAIVENVANARKVHIIDLRIGSGVQWFILMEALVVRYECLKISALASTSTQRIKVQETGKRLTDVAKTMNLPFSFNIVMVPDINDLKKDSFEHSKDEEEALVVYSSFFLNTLLVSPFCLESVMHVIRDLKPRMVVITEPDISSDLQPFMDRFIASICFFSAFFDCLDACMDRINVNRMATESVYLSYAIENMIACEGEERTVRHQKIDYWRDYLSRFGMVETELSKSSLYQAILVIKKLNGGTFCTLDMNEKSLIIGWKGTPIYSLSVWKLTSTREDGQCPDLNSSPMCE